METTAINNQEVQEETLIEESGRNTGEESEPSRKLKAK
jgi:hypothetical protein